MFDSPNGVYPAPPGLHWGVLLAVALALRFVDARLIAAQIFMGVALLTLAILVCELDEASRGVALICVGIAFSLIRFVVLGLPHRHLWIIDHLWIFSILTYVFVRAAQFDMRRSLEAHYSSVEPFGLQLSPVLLLLFGTYYLQYHFYEIAMMKRAMV